MSNFALTLARPTLADRIFARSAVTDLALILSGTALTALSAQLIIPMYPVPFTMQTFVVLIVGSTLGTARGTLSMLLYAVLGLVGLPIFGGATSGPAVLFGASGGYIIGFVFAAALTGWLAQSNWDKKFLGAAVSFVAGGVVIFAFGLMGLSLSLHLGLQETLAGGLYPFAVTEVLKAALATALIPSAWKLVKRIDDKRK
ncbi:biotin transporter BioY [Parafrigoribacterium mesophilum]|uniref:biotin transporter BioY n=1 Tax=Parafrigoribacterium mesophilum TaxID=433646 RepID=UPI0031FDD56B